MGLTWGFVYNLSDCVSACVAFLVGCILNSITAIFFNKNLDLVNRDISRPFHAAVAGLLFPRYLVRNVPSM